MKNVNNNEMDLALRSLAKSARDESSLLSERALPELDDVRSEHLDADELNTYAEGLIPEAARFRYTEHLADCSNCRRILVSLTQSRVPASEASKTEVERGPGFWEKISGFLSLPAVRYGVPALALTAVIAIALLALRDERRPDLVAQNQPEPATNAVPNTQLPSAQTNQQPPAPASVVREASPSATPGSPSTSDVTTLKSLEAEKPKVGESPTTASNAPVILMDKTEPAPPPAPAAAAELARSQSTDTTKFGTLAGKPAPKETSKGEDKKLEQPEDRRADQQRERSEEQIDVSKDAEEDNAFRAGTRSGPSRAGGLMSDRGSGRKNKRDSADEDDTRNIGGRSFRRQGSAWVDTGYASPRATINVRRGSEQYRALVADEPGIRTIAEALSGDVIVVWKGKAYRIR